MCGGSTLGSTEDILRKIVSSQLRKDSFSLGLGFLRAGNSYPSIKNECSLATLVLHVANNICSRISNTTAVNAQIHTKRQPKDFERNKRKPPTDTIPRPQEPCHDEVFQASGLAPLGQGRGRVNPMHGCPTTSAFCKVCARMLVRGVCY